MKNLEAKLFIFAGLALAAAGFLMIDYYVPRIDPIANAMNDNVSFGGISIPYRHILLCALALIGFGSYRLWVVEAEKPGNWRRGLLRLWIVASLVWGAIIATDVKIPATPIVHVMVSDTETRDYPIAWGVDRIEADLKARFEAKYKAQYEWLAGVPEARKTECKAIPKGTPDMPEDCIRIYVARFLLGLSDTQLAEVRNASTAYWHAITLFAIRALAPPIAMLVLGIALVWVSAGFRKASH